jgi:hypothetical protein
MASLETIRLITIKATAEGVDPATQSLNKLAAAQDNVAVVSDKSSKSTLSMQNVLDKQQRSLDANWRSSTQYGKAVSDLERAHAQGLTTLDRHNQLMGLAADKYGQASTTSKAFAAATTGVSAQLIALSAGAGPVGVFLAALGPWGIAAAVGLGAVAAAFNYVAEESARMGQKSIDLQQFAAVTGLTVSQIAALRAEGAELGIAGDKITMSFERMTGQLAEAHRANGTLYEDVRKINVGLADELRQTTTTADAINVLARAYKQAGDDATKAQIARAAFGGRGGQALGPVLGQIADAGSLGVLSDKMRSLNDATDVETKHWAQMQAQIDETNKRAKNILASIFTEEGLQMQLAAAQVMERIARAAKSIADQQQGLTAAQRFMVDQTRTGGVDTSGVGVTMPAGNDADAAMMAARFRLGNQLSAGVKLSPADIQAWNQLGDAFAGVGTKGKALDKTLLDLQNEAAAAAKQTSELNAFLGSGATIQEKLAARLATINSLYLDNKTGVTDVAKALDLKNRAEGAARLESTIQLESLRLGLMGNLANVSEVVTAKQNAINRANQEGAKISDTLAANIRLQTQAQAEASKLQTSAQFGIFDPTRQLANAKLELQSLFNDPSIIKSPENYADAWAVLTKRMKETSDQAAVARSTLPQLTQFMLDAGNMSKQFDTLGTTGLNDFNSSLLDFQMGTKSAGDAMKDFEAKFARSLLNMMNQMLILQPIAAALKAALPGGGGGGGFNFMSFFGAGGGAGNGMAATGEFPMAHSGGMIGIDSFPMREINPTGGEPGGFGDVLS